MDNSISLLAATILIGLAAWRISWFFYSEDGPFGIAKKIRRLIGFDEKDQAPQTFLGELFDCVWCMSIWAAMMLSLLLYFFPEAGIFICVSFGASTIVIIINEHFVN